MKMLPENTGFDTASYSVYPSKTYHIDLDKKRIYGFCDGAEAMRQAIYKILAAVRFEEIIYSDGYGSEIADYMDRLTPYVWAELERVIRRALLYDDRINAVEDFEFEEDRKNRVLKVSFRVESDEGSLIYTQEVNGYV